MVEDKNCRTSYLDFALALYMCTHPRLGQSSLLGKLKEDTLRLIASKISFRYMAGMKIGGSEDFTIQEAVKKALNDDTIIVRANSKNIEWTGYLTINKSLHFMCEELVNQDIQIDLDTTPENNDCIFPTLHGDK
jgi:hypothetical protein